MNSKNNRPEQAAELRKRAEKIAAEKAAQSSEDMEGLSPKDTRQMLHELRVHQIELEMQNEELRQAQLELDAEREKYFNFYNLAPVGYFTLSEKGLILEVNFTAATLMGVAPCMLVKQPLTRFILPDDQDILYRSLKKLLKSGGPLFCDLRIVKKDETAFWVNLSATTAPGAGGNIVYRVVMSDITERKRAEEAQGESVEKFRSLYNSMSEGMALHQLIYDPAGKAVDYLLVSVNPAFEAIIGLKADQVLGHKATEIYGTAEAPYLDVYAKVVTTRQPAKFDSKFEPMGKFFRIIVFSPAKDQFATVFEDITDRKRAEEQIKESLAEKEILLREVHHRVKNNLAAIMGLLDMEAHALDDELARSSFVALSNRIRSMALVHEQLYRSENFSRIKVQDYLKSLIAHIQSSYACPGNIHISVTATDVVMALDNAVPCGLLATELVTNAFKYAFPSGRPRFGAENCEIAVSAEWDGHVYTLTVADNGEGLPADMDWMNTKTLGLSLVKMLGQHQLQGRIELDRTGGTTFRLRFELRKDK